MKALAMNINTVMDVLRQGKQRRQIKTVDPLYIMISNILTSIHLTSQHNRRVE